MALLKALTGILGRVCLCALFLVRTLMTYLPHFSATVGEMRKARVPYSQATLTGIIVCSLAGSALVVLGYKSRIGAALLLAILVVTTYHFDDFWRGAVDPREKLTQFLKNLGLAGAMLMILANGSGAGSLERQR